jgi:hypothetical protein
VIRDPGNSAAFIEVKWGAVGEREARVLLRKLRDKARLTGLQEGVNEFVLVLGKADWFEEPVKEIKGLGKVVNYESVIASHVTRKPGT